MKSLQALRYQPELVTQILTDRSGKQFRVVFSVVEVNGELKARVVSAEPIEARIGKWEVGSGNHFRLCLPCANFNETIRNSQFPIPTSFISPYFSLEYLINSQPTRAPAF